MEMLGEAGIASRACARVAELPSELARGAGAVVLTEEIVWADDGGHIERALRMQEPWSLIPMLLIAREARQTPSKDGSRALPGVTVLPKDPCVLPR